MRCSILLRHRLLCIPVWHVCLRCQWRSHGTACFVSVIIRERSSVHPVAPEFTALKSHCDRRYLRNLRTGKKAGDDASVNHDRNAPAGTGGAPAFCPAGSGPLAASAGQSGSQSIRARETSTNSKSMLFLKPFTIAYMTMPFSDVMRCSHRHRCCCAGCGKNRAGQQHAVC